MGMARPPIWADDVFTCTMLSTLLFTLARIFVQHSLSCCACVFTLERMGMARSPIWAGDVFTHAVLTVLSML